MLQFLLVLVGLVCGILLGLGVQTIAPELLAQAFQSFFVIVGAVCGLIIVLAVIVFIFRTQIIRLVLGVTAANATDVVTGVDGVVSAAIAGQPAAIPGAVTTLAKTIVGLYAGWSLRGWLFGTAVALITALGGLFATYVLIQQNRLFSQQNDFVSKQNDLVSRQNELVSDQSRLIGAQYQASLLQVFVQEASRRSVLAPSVAQVIGKINNEAQAERETEAQAPEDAEPAEGDEGKWSPDIVVPSSNLVREATTILVSLGPYIVLDAKVDAIAADPNTPLADIVSARFTSPERGQILKALMSNLVSLGPEDGFLDPDFSYADMRGFALDPQENVDVSFNCESGTESLYTIVQGKFAHIDFTDAEINGVDLTLGDAIVDNATFSNSQITLWGDHPAHDDRGMKLVNSRLIASSIGNISLSGVKMNQDSCLIIEEPVEQTGETGSVDIRGLDVLVDPTTLALQANWKEFVFSTIVEGGENLANFAALTVTATPENDGFGDYLRLSIR